MTEPQGTDRHLADVFVTLADTLVADFDVLEMLDVLVRACVDTLGWTAAGLLLGDQRGNLQVLASSEENMRLLEVFQLQSDEGPCLDCFSSGSAVTVVDIGRERERWPRFAPVASDLGFVGVHAVPLRLRETTIGALNLFNSIEGNIAPETLRFTQALADTATIGILQARAIEHQSLLAEQLQAALNSRVIIEQAKGVLTAQGAADMDEAFALLRRYSRNTNTRLSEVARAVATKQLHLDELRR